MKKLDCLDINSKANFNELYLKDLQANGLRTARSRFSAILKALNGNYINILDAGCGNSTLLSALSIIYPTSKLAGLDYSEEAIKMSKLNYHFIDFHCGDILDNKLPINYYDLIICSEVIEHVQKPELLIKQLSANLKIGGTLLITTPYLEFTRCKAHDPYHIWEFDLKDIQKLASPYCLNMESSIIKDNHYWWAEWILFKGIKK